MGSYLQIILSIDSNFSPVCPINLLSHNFAKCSGKYSVSEFDFLNTIYFIKKQQHLSYCNAYCIVISMPTEHGQLDLALMTQKKKIE